jgi:hypothetical protein
VNFLALEELARNTTLIDANWDPDTGDLLPGFTPGLLGSVKPDANETFAKALGKVVGSVGMPATRQNMKVMVWMTNATSGSPEFDLAEDGNHVRDMIFFFFLCFILINGTWTTEKRCECATTKLRDEGSGIDYRCEDGQFLVLARCVTKPNPDPGVKREVLG